MLLRFKLRLGALVLLVGAGLAVVGELFTLWNTNPLTGGWFVSMGLITLGTLAPSISRPEAFLFRFTQRIRP